MTRTRHGRPGGTRRRGATLFAIVAGGWWAALAGTSALTVLMLVDGVAGVVVAAVLGLLAVGGLVVMGRALGRRRRDRRQREEVRRRAAAVPPGLRRDWRRLDQARALLDDLVADGWVSAEAVVELDAHTDQLRALGWAEHRARQLGGRASAALRRQVGELTTLLVGLADEAVEQRAEVIAGSVAPVTLSQARDRMVALRAARREVDGVDRAGNRAATG